MMILRMKENINDLVMEVMITICKLHRILIVAVVLGVVWFGVSDE